MKQAQLNRIEESQKRIEAKLDALLEAVAEEDDEEEQQFDLDGNPLEIVERNQNESLD